MEINSKIEVLSAADVGANHQRERIWIVGYTNDNGQIATKIRGSAIKRGNDCETRQKQASQFAGPSKQHAELANTRCKNGGERNATRMATSSKKWATSAIHNQPGCEGCNEVSNANSTQCQRNGCSFRVHKKHSNIGSPCWWEAEPNVGRVADGVAFTVDRLKAIGNGQVPLCAATAFELLRHRFKE